MLCKAMSHSNLDILQTTAASDSLSQQRQQLVERWLVVSGEQLQVAYETEFRQAFLSLRSTTLRYLPLSEAEQAYVQQLEQHLRETRSLPILLALTLYRFAYQSSINLLKGFPIPGWLLPDVVDYLLEPIAFFREVGDADRYVNFLLRLGRNLAAQVRQNPDAAIWQDVAQRFATANFLPCYSSSLNLKELYQLRSQLLEVTLKTEVAPLDYTFAPRSQRQWLKLGVLVTTFLPNPETLINLPIFDFLNHKQFHIILYSFSPGDSSTLQYCRTRCDRWILLSENISEAVDRIRQDDLDILWIGTDVTTTVTPATRLCHYRLARIQVTSGTSPVSTGVRHIDHYLLGSHDAQSASPDHYSETLTVIPDTSTSCWGMHILKTNLTTVYPNRHDWQADDNTVIFISGASLNKLIPEVLHTWAALLAEVPNAMLVLYVHPSAKLPLSYPTAEFVQWVHEILAAHQVEANRFIFLDQIATRENVKAYLRLADLYLEAFPATSPEAVIDALEVSLPIVTLAGETLRQTYTASLLRELQLDDWVTHTLSEYFERARLWASDPVLRHQHHQRLRQKMADWPNFLNTVQFGQKVGRTLQTLFSQWLAQQATLPTTSESVLTGGFGSRTPVSSSAKANGKKVGRKSKRMGAKVDWAVLETDAQLKQLVKPISDWLAEGEYGRVVVHCETAIAKDPQLVILHGYLAIAQVLQGQVEKAKATLETALSQAADPSDRAQRTEALVNLLIQEAETQKTREEWLAAVRLRQQVYQLIPEDCVNRLWILDYAVRGKMFASQTLDELKIIEDLTPEVLQRYGIDKLPELLKAVINYDPHSENLLALTTACLRCITQPQTYGLFISSAVSQLANINARPDMAIALAERYLDIAPGQTDVLRNLASTYIQFMSQQTHHGLALAQRYDELAPTLLNKLFANHLCIKALQAMGRWSEVSARWQRHKDLSEKFAQLDPALSSSADSAFGALATSVFLAPYFEDTPRENSRIRNQIIETYQKVIARENQHLLVTYTPPPPLTLGPRLPQRPLKIGYLSYCFTNHSVGWLARWLIEHHDRRQFDLYGYFINYRPRGDFLQSWYTKQFTHPRRFGTDIDEMIKYIRGDDLDILIELDSLTIGLSLTILSLKLAPIQVTWLGWDASGLPGIDYYLVDPYVVPDDAQAYYRETLWRLPHTYLAVDGFEIGVPNLRRRHLGIPDDAVIYYTGQTPSKWNLATLKMQLEILKAVPNSYFLIKGLATEIAIQEIFRDLAEEAGVKADRLRFLPKAPTEAIHRANLQIADVVLDTYPYNGATTTMETLWVGVPLVTRVGQQFSSRNSYTMLVNAGIEEGIAWTDAEYVEWGIRYGTDPQLRRLVKDKLLQSRQTAPLWDAAQFTRDVESAYVQMWQRYVS